MFRKLRKLKKLRKLRKLRKLKKLKKLKKLSHMQGVVTLCHLRNGLTTVDTMSKEVCAHRCNISKNAVDYSSRTFVTSAKLLASTLLRPSLFTYTWPVRLSTAVTT